MIFENDVFLFGQSSFFSHDLFNCPLADFAGNEFAAKEFVRAKTLHLHQQTYNRPPIQGHPGTWKPPK